MACGATNKPKEQIVDFDSADVNDELAVVEYVDDMYKFYKLEEVISYPLLGFSYFPFCASPILPVLTHENYLCRMAAELEITWTRSPI